MLLYSDPESPYSHRARVVLAEKGIACDVKYVDPTSMPDDILEVNPYGTLPVLVDRDLGLYDSRVIMEYLDERFPHPPLLPVDPVSRATCKLVMFRIEQDWYSLLADLERGSDSAAAKARQLLAERLTMSADVFAARPFYMSHEFTLVDCYIAPLLWRLQLYGIKLPTSAKAVNDYAKRIFGREAFRQSLSEAERAWSD